MRLSFVLPGFSPDPIGGDSVVYEYATRLSERGHDVTVVHAVPLGLSRAFRSPRRLVVRSGIRWLTAQQLRWARVGDRVRLLGVPSLEAKYLPDADMTVLSSWETVAAANGATSRHGQLAQLVQDYERWKIADAKTREQIEDALRRPGITRVAISAAVTGMLEAIGSNWTATVESGIDHSKWGCDLPMAMRPRKIVFPSRVGTHKGTAQMLAAAEDIAKSHSDWSIECFGPGPSNANVVTARGVISVEDLRRLYNEAAIFVLPSLYEGWGLPALEAMACGSAVVTNANGGSEGFTVAEVNALVMPRNDADCIAKAVNRLIADPDLRERLSHEAVRTAGRYTWVSAVSQLSDALKLQVGHQLIQ